MDSDDTDLIRRLCTKVGCIMEDASVVALIWSDDTPLDARLDALQAAASDVGALIAAAKAVARSSIPDSGQ